MIFPTRKKPFLALSNAPIPLQTLGAAAALVAAVVAVEQRSGSGEAGLLLSYALQVCSRMQ